MEHMYVSVATAAWKADAGFGRGGFDPLVLRRTREWLEQEDAPGSKLGPERGVGSTPTSRIVGDRGGT